jgi:hypothetical protein
MQPIFVPFGAGCSRPSSLLVRFSSSLSERIGIGAGLYETRVVIEPSLFHVQCNTIIESYEYRNKL